MISKTITALYDSDTFEYKMNSIFLSKHYIERMV